VIGQSQEVVERRIPVEGTPRVRASNVSGTTSVRPGEAGAVTVVARKRVRGASEDRAKRMLENVEIRIEQVGDEITIEPRFYQQERGWLDLFREGRIAVDLEITVPRDSQVALTSVSGDIDVRGTHGALEVATTSGDVTVDGVEGSARLRSVSGDLNVTGYSGQVDVNSVSGDLSVSGSRVRLGDVVTVSGDIEIDAVLSRPDGDARLKTVSGDIELALGPGPFEIEHSTLSGDIEVQGRLDTRVEKLGRRDRRVSIGSGGPHIRVKSVSGDLSLRLSSQQDLADVPGVAPAAPAGAPAPRADVREMLARVARGELSVEDAAAAIDAAKG
jgi:DUF4097 and DUF4098 domain-containing protein YvlB